MKTYTFQDRSSWKFDEREVGAIGEPDKAVWTDEATGFVCMIHRNGGGALCGYVAVEPGHPWFGKDYNDLPADAHGGLTFSARCNPQATEERGICHVPEPGKPDDVWWLGFDCAHCGDISPAYDWSDFNSIYRNFDYVKREVENLARQAKEAA